MISLPIYFAYSRSNSSILEYRGGLFPHQVGVAVKIDAVKIDERRKCFMYLNVKMNVKKF